MAVWIYMPGGSGKNFYCDDCVPRGCSCNVRNIDNLENNVSLPLMWWGKEEDLFSEGSHIRRYDSYYVEVLDDKLRRAPCSEYEYDEDGFDIDETKYGITFSDFVECIWNNKNRLHISQGYAVVISSYQSFVDEQLIAENVTHYHLLDYNEIMSVFYSLSKSYLKDNAYNVAKNRKFYESFKNELRSRRVLIDENSYT